MSTSSIRRRIPCVLVTLLCLLGCTAGPRPVSSATRPSQQSVRPGVNDRYFEPRAADNWTDVFEGESREVFLQRRAIVERLGLREGMVVGDIGAGTGLFTLPIARAVGTSGKVLAVDIVPAFLERVAARAREAGLANVEAVLARPRVTRLPEGSLDLAFLCNVYHHIEYPDVYMRSVLASLRPGASMVLIDFERIPGVTSRPMLKHVRASKQTVIAEVAATGFELVQEDEFLTQNYYLTFRRP